ncbi:MAG: YdeI/OmpD-associated family protein [Solirubrobacterales bacterium]|nr:YdeI/OmpD-associated family protein [Solirubrobacterales bacterium]
MDLARLDDQPRGVEAPAELASTLAGDPEAEAIFGELSFTHRTEYASWVAEAKRGGTRSQRAANAIRMLREEVRTPT